MKRIQKKINRRTFTGKTNLGDFVATKPQGKVTLQNIEENLEEKYANEVMATNEYVRDSLALVNKDNKLEEEYFDMSYEVLLFQGFEEIDLILKKIGGF